MGELEDSTPGDMRTLGERGVRGDPRGCAWGGDGKGRRRFGGVDVNDGDTSSRRQLKLYYECVTTILDAMAISPQTIRKNISDYSGQLKEGLL